MVFIMPLSTTQKQAIINKFQTAKGDTGSPEVQIALLSTRITRLAEHLKSHAHDVHSRRGLLSMIAKRRRLINFLKKVDEKRVGGILKDIGLKD
jgi:small subunit ribosomal protein S15